MTEFIICVIISILSGLFIWFVAVLPPIYRPKLPTVPPITLPKPTRKFCYSCNTVNTSIVHSYCKRCGAKL